MNLSKHVKLIQVEVPTAAGTSDIETDVVDMQGYEGCMFIVPFGAITSGAVTSIKAQQGAASDGSDMDDLEGSSQTVADSESNKSRYIDLYKPAKRYVRAVVDRGTQNAVVSAIFALLYDAHVKPVVQDGTNIAGGELFRSPAEGTA